jgi:hypothetical protein
MYQRQRNQVYGGGSMARFDVASPRGRTVVEVGLDDDGHLSCRARRDDELVVTARLGVERADTTFERGLAFAGAPTVSQIDERYRIPHGKRRTGHDHATIATFGLVNRTLDPVEVDIRVYDDALAFRYRFPGPTGQRCQVMRELTTITLEADGRAWLQPVSPADWPADAHDNLYADGPPLATPSPTRSWHLPATFHTGCHWLLVGEADLDANYHGSHLTGTPDGRSYAVAGPDPWEGRGRGDAVSSATLPWTLPWRFVVLADSAPALLESTVTTDLARPTTLTDMSWIRPGRASWSWWSDASSPRDVRVLRRYVDLAAEMGWEYALVGPGWTANPDAEMQDLVRRATQRGVGLWLWYNSGGPHTDEAAEPRDLMHEVGVRRRELARIASWGVVGVTVGFFHSDKQDGIARYLDILEDAAEARLMVAFRDCTIPRGWERTWPHLMTMQAVRGAEWYRINRSFADDAVWHNTLLPFTRNVVGPMDYTPVTFSDTFRPHRTTTAHELALAVVYESGVVHMADSAESYRAQNPAVLDVLRTVPAAWDDVVGLAGTPGERVVLARRADDTWWLAGINGRTPHPGTELDLRRLGTLAGTWRIVHDGSSRDEIVARDVSTGPTFRTPAMPAGGGFVARLVGR